MKFLFTDKKLETLYTSNKGAKKYSPDVVRGFRKVVKFIELAQDERDLKARRGLNFERLKGDRKHQHSLRINDQWRLIVALQQDGTTKIVAIIKIEDYH